MQEVNFENPTRIDISRNILDISKTFDCGQCFRWNAQSSQQWVGVVNGKVYYIAQTPKDSTEEFILTSASMKEWETELKPYLDIERDYTTTIPKDDTFATEASLAGAGIRILNQDPWETLISFIISQRNNIPKIKSTVDKLCKSFGDKLEIGYKDKIQRDSIYSFPTPDKIAKLSLEELKPIGLGYRDEYVLLAARQVAEGKLDLERLKGSSISTDEAIYTLMQLKGVGIKVANCVALFGLHRLDTFPIDVWIKRIIDTYYGGNLDPRVYGDKSGLIQQYMFYYIKNS